MFKCLVIGAGAETRGLLESTFRHPFYELVQVEHLPQGRKLLHEQQCDLVIIDNSALDGEASSFCRELKRDQSTRFIPVMILSAGGSDEERINSYRMGVDDFIVMPVSSEELQSRVQNRLGKSMEIRRISDQLRQMNVLFQINSLAHESLNLKELAPQIPILLKDSFDAESAAVYLSDESDQIFLAGFDGPVLRSDLIKLERILARKVILEGRLLALRDMSADPRFASVQLDRPEDFHTLISIPLMLDGKAIGTLEMYNLPQLYIEEERLQHNMLNVAHEMAKVIGLSRKYTDLYDQLQLAANEIAVLYEISNALSSTLNQDELLGLIVRNAMKSFDSQVVSLMLLDEEGQLAIRCAEGLSDDIVAGTRVRLGEGIAGKVAATGQPLLLVDVIGMDDVGTANVKSALSVPLKVRDEVIGVLNVSKTARYHFTEVDLKLCNNLASLATQAIEKARLYGEIKRSLEEMHASYLSTVKSLSMAIEAKDPYTQGHVDRVTKYGMAIAMELDPELLDDDMFRFALVLHDVGKIAVPEDILTKAEALTRDEWEKMKIHPEAGARIISPVNFLAEAVKAVRYHQERFDGKGYPEGLRGEEIPLAARIIAVADAFDAMITDRPYRKAPGFDFAREEIVRHSGSQFDPQVVEAFLRALDSNIIP